MNIKKGDQVKIITGKDRGKTGKVIKVFLEENKITVEGVNLYKKRVRPRKTRQKGEVVLVARPLAGSNVMLVCSACGKPTRVGHRRERDQGVRYCKKCKAVIS